MIEECVLTKTSFFSVLWQKPSLKSVQEPILPCYKMVHALFSPPLSVYIADTLVNPHWAMDANAGHFVPDGPSRGRGRGRVRRRCSQCRRARVADSSLRPCSVLLE